MHVTALLRAAHLGPVLAVTAVVALLAVAAGLEPMTALRVVVAVLTGQLVIGWSNDLIDVRRDTQVGRSDKPLATGQLDVRTLLAALAVAAVATVSFSLSLGWRAGLVHLLLGVGGGVAYNLGLKATAWSWLPYAVAFGSLPAVVSLSGMPPAWAPWPLLAAGALLGVGAHFVNVLPDLDDDAETGVRGLPHRLGRATAQRVATAVLVLASAVVVLGPEGAPPLPAWVALALTAMLGVVALTGRGRAPFRAAVGIALVNVVMLTAAGGGRA